MNKPGKFASMREANEWLKVEAERQQKHSSAFDELTSTMQEVAKAAKGFGVARQQWGHPAVISQSDFKAVN